MTMRPPSIAATLPLLLLGGILSAGTTLAQDTQEQPLLPDLAPREVEIRGELEVRFPLLERQPLVGFNPPPQIPVLPAGRRPLVEDYKQDRADLPQSAIDRPDAPVSLAGAETAMNGEIEAGAGSYFDRLVRARVSGSPADNLTFRLRADYFGSDGTTVIPGADVRNPFDSIEGDIAVEYETGQVRTGAEIAGFADYYSLYGDASTFPVPVAEFPDGADRTGRGFGTTLWLKSARGSATEYSIETTWSTSDFETELTDIAGPSERRLDVATGVALPFGPAALTADFRGGTAGDDGSFAGTSEQFVSGAIGGILPNLPGLSASAAIRILGTRYDSQFSTDGSQRKLLYLSGDVNVAWTIVPSVTLFATNDAWVDENDLGDVFRRSPFAESEPALGPTLNVIDATAGVRLTLGSVSIAPFGGYRWSPNQLYFSAGQAGSTVPATRPIARHDRAATWRAGARIGAGITGSLTAAVSGEYRDAQLTALDTPVPYYPTVVSEGTLTYRFLSDRALLRIQARYEDGRAIDETGTIELDPITALDVLASYDVTPNIGFTLRGLNLTDSALEHWNLYQRTGRQFVGGIRIRW